MLLHIFFEVCWSVAGTLGVGVLEACFDCITFLFWNVLFPEPDLIKKESTSMMEEHKADPMKKDLVRVLVMWKC